MAGQRLPLEVVQARGSKHLTKAEIQERQEREIKPITDNIIAPTFLTKKQTDEFYKIAEQLQKLKIMGETDVDALARYIIANDFYINAVKQMRKSEVKNSPVKFTQWAKIQERYFKQCRASANDLGLSISSRCRLVVPETKKETPKENKFKKFEKRAVKGE
jgi:P27 family predicted phage terminase small subunit